MAAIFSSKHYTFSNPPAPEAVFKTELDQINTSTAERCAEACETELASGPSSELIPRALALNGKFASALAEKALRRKQQEELGAAFTDRLLASVEKKWAEAMAKDFEPIPAIRDQTTWLSSAESWASQFYKDVEGIGKLQQYPIVDEFVKENLEKVTNAFQTRVYKQMESKAEEIAQKAERNPDSLTDEEAEFFGSQLANIVFCSVNRLAIPDPESLTRGVTMMRSLVAYERTCHQAPVNQRVRDSLFLKAFAKV